MHTTNYEQTNQNITGQQESQTNGDETNNVVNNNNNLEFIVANGLEDDRSISRANHIAIDPITSIMDQSDFANQERSYSSAHLDCNDSNSNQQVNQNTRVRAQSVSATQTGIANLRQGSGSDSDMVQHASCIHGDVVERSLSSTLASIHSVHPQIDLNLNERFLIMPMNDQIRELQTVIRDKRTSRGNFKFFADRLIRLVVEEGLNRLPIEKVEVRTPTGHIFEGIRYLKGNCGVSIVRSGESMEQGLRDCCRSIRIGKILIESDENNQARALYAKFPRDIAQRRILLLYPIMSTGLAVIESVKVLLNHGVKEDNLILLNLFSSPKAAKLINAKYPRMFVLTSDINPICPNHFGHRYFGTD